MSFEIGHIIETHIEMMVKLRNSNHFLEVVGFGCKINRDVDGEVNRAENHEE